MEEIFDNELQMAIIIALSYMFVSFGGSLVLERYFGVDGTQNSLLHKLKRVCDFNKNNMIIVSVLIVLISYCVLLNKDECNIYQFHMTHVAPLTRHTEQVQQQVQNQMQQVQNMDGLRYNPLHTSVSNAELKHNLQRFFASL